MVVERVPIDSIRPMEPRVREHSRQQIRAAERSTDRYGQLLPIPISERGEILDLEMIWIVLKNAGATHIDVVVIRNKTPAELKGIRLMLNRLAQEASWNDKGLREVFQELLTVDFDLDDTGFAPPEIELRLNLDLPEANVEENGPDIPPLEECAVTSRGMIWDMDGNRVGCGDGTDTAFVSGVLSGRLADAVFTDPPWNIPVDGFISGNGRHRHREFVQGAGEMSDDTFFAFLCALLEVLRVSSKPSALVFCCIDWRHLTEMNVAARRCGMALYNICVWTKTNGGMGGIYRNAHEMIPVYLAGDQQPLNNVKFDRYGRTRTDVWSYAGVNSFGRHRETLLSSHSITKPVALVSDALRDATKRGDVVLDTFLGFGTTLMAAQKTGRICCGTELDPRYVDLIVRRWQRATGLDAIRTDTGESFNAGAQRLLTSRPGANNAG